MKPYYDDGSVTIYHGDSREILPELGSAALTLTDPPWEAQVDIVAGCTNALELWGDVAPLLVERSDRVLVWLPTHADPRKWLNPVELPFLRTITIRRAIPGYFGRVLMDTEQAYVLGTWPKSGKGRHIIPGGLQITYTPNDRLNGHPAPRSAIVARWLVKFWSDRDDVILDPFCGSGTSLRAAKDLGRKAIGIELEERYCELAARYAGQEVLDLPPDAIPEDVVECAAATGVGPAVAAPLRPLGVAHTLDGLGPDKHRVARTKRTATPAPRKRSHRSLPELDAATVAVATDVLEGAGASLDSTPCDHSVPVSSRSPVCALCGLAARMWSGVESWFVDGAWIGWCSKECQRRWLNGWRPDPDHHGKLIHSSDDRRSGGA